MKTTIAISISQDIIEKIRRTGVNVSHLCEEAMNSYLNIKNTSLDDVNYEVLCTNLAIKRDQKVKTDTELLSLERQKHEIDAKSEQARLQALEDEKQKMEESKKCLNCGKMMNEQLKSHTFTKGLVCHGCFLNANGESYRRWNSED